MNSAALSSTYENALGFLYGRINYERGGNIPYRTGDFRLDRMRQLVARLQHPEADLRIIHVAGTKGKGSTSAMIASALQHAGLRTGLYTSPHLERLEERFVVNGECCSPSDLVRLVEQIEPVVNELDREQSILGGRGPTFFEITTAMGLLYFARQRTDAVVLEVGLGGRLDSTNICQPQISVITSISFDHTRQLGNTLAKIAREKAGIIKPGIPVISGVLLAEPRQVIEAVADDCRSRLFQLGSDFHVRYQGRAAMTAQGETSVALMEYWENEPQETSFRNLRLGLLGEHQSRNAGLAIATLLRLRGMGWNVPDDAIRKGIAAPRCPARIEVMSSHPTTIIDVAHNTASIAALMKVLDEEFQFQTQVANRRRTLIFAASQDKDVRGMLQLLLAGCDRLILTRFCTNPRSVPPNELFQLVKEILASESPPEVLLADTPARAWEVARTGAGAEDVICITGSFFLAAEMRPIVRGDGTIRH